MTSPWAAAGVALLVSLVATPLVRRATFRWGLLDWPSARSSHRRPTPRGGGLAVVLGATAGLAAARLPWSRGAVTIVAGAAALALLGLSDDRFGLPRALRLLVQLLVATAVVLACGGLSRLPLPAPLDLPLGPLAAPLAVLWIVAVVNFYNFMDGIDGLAGIQGVVTGAGVALAVWDPLSSACGAALAGACLGFLVFNWAPARIFLGDVGSLFLGYTLAVLPFLARQGAREGHVFFMALSLWLFLSDATWTLVSRLLRVRRWYEPHREHLYQRLVDGGWSHARTAAAIGLGSLILTGAALAAGPGLDAARAWPALLLATTLSLAERRLARRRTTG